MDDITGCYCNEKKTTLELKLTQKQTIESRRKTNAIKKNDYQLVHSSFSSKLPHYAPWGAFYVIMAGRTDVKGEVDR